ncbi:MAG: hypothetical protein ACTSQI_17230 [Candidatus Helarchaeota archaeon]
MLERCPYYENCSGTIRNIRGNREYYCLGSLNWEFCPQFKDYLLTGESNKGFGRDETIQQVARTIFLELKNKSQSSLIISLISSQGKVIYCDRRWTETYLLVTQNIVRYLIDSIKVGEYIKLQNAYNFLFMKIHDEIMLICMTQTKLEPLINFFQEKFPDYKSRLDNYLKQHPLKDENKSDLPPEKNSVLELFTNIQHKLETTQVDLIIHDLYKIQEKISNFFSWNKIFYEISVLIEELEAIPVQHQLNPQERTDILKKIRVWQEKIHQTN